MSSAEVQDPGRVPSEAWHEFAACISEGWCPACRHRFTSAMALAPGITWASCASCRCTWEYDRRCYVPVIAWHGTVDGQHLAVLIFRPAPSDGALVGAED